MNKFQKICLLITILFALDFALDILLDLSFILRFIDDNTILYKVYAFVIGVCGFVNITLYNKE